MIAENLEESLKLNLVHPFTGVWQYQIAHVSVFISLCIAKAADRRKLLHQFSSEAAPQQGPLTEVGNLIMDT